MNRKHNSGVFMMEMIAVVFFFILCASICILVFAKADRLSRKADSLNQGVFIAQSVAEVWKEQGKEGLTGHFYTSAEENGEHGGLVLWFGSDGLSVPKEHEVYRAVAQSSPDPQGADTRIEISVFCGDEDIYSLTVYRHEKTGNRRAEDGKAEDRV